MPVVWFNIIGNNNIINSTNQAVGSFGVLLATVIGSVSLVVLIVLSIFFITSISILAMYKAKSTRDISQEQESDSTNRAEYEEIEIHQRSEPTVISTTDNVAYEHITKKVCD